MTLEMLPTVLAICRLAPGSEVPRWAMRGPFYSVTQTEEELSIVCPQADVPGDIQAERNWRCLKVRGPLDFSLTGILAALANPLAQAGISIFAVSTFDTDYLLVKQDAVERAVEILTKAGHEVVSAAES